MHEAEQPALILLTEAQLRSLADLVATATKSSVAPTVVLSEQQLRNLVIAIGKAIAEQPGALTAARAAAYLDLSGTSFHRLVSSGKLPDPVILPGFGTNGKAKRWLRKDLDEWLAKSRRKKGWR